MLVALALAHAQTDLDQAWWAAQRACWDDVLVHTARGLAGDADRVGLHRARTYALQRKGATRDLAMYDAWHTADPDDLGVRVGLASSLLGGPSPPCARVHELLAPRASASVPDRYQAWRVADHALRSCEDAFDRKALDAELAALVEAAHPESTSLARLREVTADPTALAPDALRAIVLAAPDRAPDFTSAVFASKKGTREHREVLLEIATAWGATDDWPRVTAASRMLDAAERWVDGAALRARVDAAVPCLPMPMRTLDRTPLQVTILDAEARPSHELALEGLDRLEKKIPDAGPDRVLWLQRRLAHLEAIDGRGDEVYAVERDLAKTDPTDLDAVNAWAYEAAQRGVDMAEALTALEGVLTALADERYPTDGSPSPRGWHGDARARRSEVHDTHGWLLHRLGRHEEALAALNTALHHDPGDGVLLAHAGLVHAALDDARLAAAYLSDALSVGIGEPALDAAARTTLEPLWTARGGWHPDGFPGWVEARRAPPPVPEPDARPALPAGPLVGQPFPLGDAEALAGSARVSLDAADGILVVDVWASWCGPCIAGMPHLAEVAASYADRGVRVVGLSVDTEKKAAIRFFKGADVPYDLAWGGMSAWETLQITGIPALFVIAPGGEVAARIEGYGAGDERLERALDALIARRAP